MTRIDQFESVFLAATRTLFTYERVEVAKVLVVTDFAGEEAESFTGRVRSFLAVLGEGVAWTTLGGEKAPSLGELMERVESEGADLVVTYRNLYTSAWRWPHSLGEHLDVLTQATDVPVLVVPRPEHDEWKDGTATVVALTDHLNGDARLVNYAVRLSASGGELCLAHVEDGRVFERYLDTVAKIPEIDTDLARREIHHRLLKEPGDYIASVKEVLRESELDLRLTRVVTTTHRVADVQGLIAERGADLVVLNTKDEDQLAMHGLAYPLAVELRTTPMLLL